MLKTALKTSTALALCAGLVAPPAAAQNAGIEIPRCVLPNGTSDRTPQYPCALKNGREVADEEELQRILDRREQRAQEGDGAEEDTDDSAEAPAEEAAPEDQAAEAPAEEAVEDAVDDVVEETPAEEEPAADDTIAEEAPPAEEPVAEAPAEEAPAAEAPAEEAPAEQPAAEAPAEEPPAEDAPEAAEAEPAAPAAPARVAPANPAGGAGLAASAADAIGDILEETTGAGIVTETLTEEDVRSSDEDFDTAPTAQGDQPAARSGNNDSLQNGLLLGLGALAVGAILYNGAKVVSNSGDRVVVEQPDGTLTVMKNDDEILRRPGSEVRTRTFEDGSTRTVVTRENGVRIVTVRAPDGTALKRVRVLPDGQRITLFDDTVAAAPVEDLPPQPAAQGITATGEDALREALLASMSQRSVRGYALGQIRAYPEVRALAPEIEVRAITFPTNSAAIPPAQAERLADLGFAIAGVIEDVPDAVFLVEGHTDAVGSAAYNLALSDRRAESVALALGEYFGVPPENLVTQGYGESDLKVDTQEDNRQNRRVVVRNITPLLQ